MNLRLANIRDDSSLHSFDPSYRDNESFFKFQFVRPVVGVRKARLSVSKSCADRTGELSCPRTTRFCVIDRSGSGKPLNRKCRALARATSASLTTRTPQAFEIRGCAESGMAGGSQPHPWFKSKSPILRSFRESRYRAVSNDRTYRRSETEQKRQNELKGNRGERLKDSRQGKSWSVSESKGNSSQTELNLKQQKRLCSKCKLNEVYLDIATQDYCEPCLYKLVQNQ